MGRTSAIEGNFTPFMGGNDHQHGLTCAKLSRERNIRKNCDADCGRCRLGDQPCRPVGNSSPPSFVPRTLHGVPPAWATVVTSRQPSVSAKHGNRGAKISRRLDSRSLFLWRWRRYGKGRTIIRSDIHLRNEIPFLLFSPLSPSVIHTPQSRHPRRFATLYTRDQQG